MNRGLRPEIATGNEASKPANATLLDTVSSLMKDRSAWEGTASELNILAASLSVRGITIEHTKTSNRRGLRLMRRYGQEWCL